MLIKNNCLFTIHFFLSLLLLQNFVLNFNVNLFKEYTFFHQQNISKFKIFNKYLKKSQDVLKFNRV